jgi:lysozyme family protein
MNFDQAFDRVIGHEGGYVNHPDDPGGETKFGISKRSYPGEDIAGMTIARAREIYRRDFWDRCRCDELPDAVRFHVFDAAVNSGVRQAAIWLQRAAGATADGIIGPKTLAAARAIDPNKLAARYCGARLRFMTDLRTWPTFGRGWARRIADNLEAT